MRETHVVAELQGKFRNFLTTSDRYIWKYCSVSTCWQDSQVVKTDKSSTHLMRFCYHSIASGSMEAEDWAHGRRFRIPCGAQCSRLEAPVQHLCLTLLVSFSLTPVFLTQMQFEQLLHKACPSKKTMMTHLDILRCQFLQPPWQLVMLFELLHHRLPFLKAPLLGWKFQLLLNKAELPLMKLVLQCPPPTLFIFLENHTVLEKERKPILKFVFWSSFFLPRMMPSWTVLLLPSSSVGKEKNLGHYFKFWKKRLFSPDMNKV